MEPLDEQVHIVSVLVSRLITQVTLELNLRRHTRLDLARYFAAPFEAGWRISVGPSILKMLNATATFVKYDSVEVNLPIPGSPQFQARRPLIELDFIS